MMKTTMANVKYYPIKQCAEKSLASKNKYMFYLYEYDVVFLESERYQRNINKLIDRPNTFLRGIYISHS